MPPLTTFLPYQQKYLRDKSQLKIWEKSRRIGATWTQAYEDVEDIVLAYEYTPGRPVRKVYFSTKDEEAGKEYIEYCMMWARVFNTVVRDMGETVIDEDDKSKTKARVLEFNNGGRIIALSSSPTAFNSKGGKIVWDEAALHKDQRSMWSGAQPAAFVWGYPIRLLSTHKGKSTLFYRFARKAAKGENQFSHHKVTIVDAVNDGLYDKVVGRATTTEERDAYVESIRKSCDSQDIFNEDYMAEPVDATTAYFTYDEISLVEVDGCLRDMNYLRQTKFPLYAGWDIGRQKDLSVIWILEEVSPFLFTRHVEEFEKTRFAIQMKFLESVLALDMLMRCCIDQTGMGIPLTEQASETRYGYKVEGVTFTLANKVTLATGLKRQFEDRCTLIPDEEKYRESIHSIKRMVTATGQIRFDAERSDLTGHADHFWALALANHAKTGGPSGEAWALSSGSSTIPKLQTYQEKINYAAYR